jgi:flagellar assembly protein FliH
LSEVLHLRRIPRTRVKLIRVHTAQPPASEHVIPGDENAGTHHHAETVSGMVIEPDMTMPDPAEALSRAYTRGEEEGKRVAETAFQEALTQQRTEEDQRIASVLTSISKQMREMQKTIESDAYHFALAVAERIVKREVALHDDIVIAQIHEAIQRIVGVESIKLRVHPADEDVVRAHRNAFLSSLGGVREVVIDTDEGMERGGCIIESASGSIDARISTQLKQIEAALFGASLGRGEPLP